MNEKTFRRVHEFIIILSKINCHIFNAVFLEFFSCRCDLILWSLRKVIEMERLKCPEAFNGLAGSRVPFLGMSVYGPAPERGPALSSVAYL